MSNYIYILFFFCFIFSNESPLIESYHTYEEIQSKLITWNEQYGNNDNPYPLYYPNSGIIYNLEHNVSNTFICSSVGGEYAAMSMPITREKNVEFYKRYGIRYNAPLLDMGINKNEERKIMKKYTKNYAKIVPKKLVIFG